MRRLVTPQSAVRGIATTRDGMYHGKLAEDYDGIGQYVLVALAGSSVAAAYKARIAAGDFGGGRTFPRGTPVSVAAHRGNLEVFLGNFPGCDPEDNFDRVVADSFEGSDVGWPQYQSSGQLSQRILGIDGSRAFLTATTANQVGYLGGAMTVAPSMPMEFLSTFELAPASSTRDVTWELEVNAFNENAIDSNSHFIETEMTSDQLAAVSRLRAQILLTDPSFSTVAFVQKTDYPVAWASAPISSRLRIESDTAYFRAWPASDGEPSDWDFSVAIPPGFMDFYSVADRVELGLGLAAADNKTAYLDHFRVTEGIECGALVPYQAWV